MSVIKNSKFKQVARKIFASSGEEDEPHLHRDRHRSEIRANRSGPNARASPSPKNTSGTHLDNRSSDELSPYEHSTGDEGSDAEIQRSNKRKGLVYQKTENFYTRLRDMVAMSDVFITRGENPPFISCLQLSVWFMPIHLFFCIWDTLAVTVFEIPYISTVDYPGFILGWHFLMLILAMYGFMLSYLSSGNSPRTKLAAISLGVHYLLLFYRVFIELFFNGFRSQWKLYLEKTPKIY